MGFYHALHLLFMHPKVTSKWFSYSY